MHQPFGAETDGQEMSQLVRVPGGPNAVLSAQRMIAQDAVRTATKMTNQGIVVSRNDDLATVKLAASMWLGKPPVVVPYLDD